jgi:LCP family protein required for cell wall assembly
MIAHIPASHDAVYLISLPRDTLVSIPAMSEFNFPGQSRAKLTEVYQVGNGAQGDDSAKGRRNGVTATSRVISQLVPGGLRFNATAIINYKGFKSLVTALGGVHMCIDEVVKSEHYDAQGKYHTSTSREGVSQYTYKKGCRDLKAWEALDYSRQRKGLPNGDYDRQRHQQQLMRAIVAKMMDKGTLTDVSKINQLRKAAGDLLTLDLGKVPMEDWIFSFKGLSEKDVVMIKTNGGTYSGGGMIDGVSYERLTPDSQKLLKAVHDDTVYDFLTQHSDWMANTK